VKPILVTGGTGFVGANVVRELVALGASVRVRAATAARWTACPWRSWRATSSIARRSSAR